MKIKALIFSLLLLFPLLTHSTSLRDAIDREVLSDYRKHDPVVFLLCDGNQTQARFYQGEIWKRVPYNLTEFTIAEGEELITLGIPIGEGYTNWFYSPVDGPATPLEPARFSYILAQSEHLFRLFSGRKNDCVQTFRV